jgi:hypothetical protein
MTYVLAAVTFLVAAKAHGRQLRVERELAGHWKVTFGRGTQNPPFVAALWRRERFIFWPAAAAIAVGLGVAVPQLAWPLAFIAIPLTAAFAIGGLLSALRFMRRRHTPPADRPASWYRSAVLGSLGWWSLTFVLAAALYIYSRHVT